MQKHDYRNFKNLYYQPDHLQPDHLALPRWVKVTKK